MTKGNEQKRYIGRTDEPLSDTGILQLKQLYYKRPDVLVSSPMLRATQTCEILFSNMMYQCVDELKETDFGAFENKSYEQLKTNAAYQDWINSNGEAPFLDGESKEEVSSRVKDGFLKVIEPLFESPIEESKDKLITFVVHGGTIMHVLDLFTKGKEKKDFYAWQVQNGCGYEAVLLPILEEQSDKDKRGINYYLTDISPIKGEEDIKK